MVSKDSVCDKVEVDVEVMVQKVRLLKMPKLIVVSTIRMVNRRRNRCCHYSTKSPNNLRDSKEWRCDSGRVGSVETLGIEWLKY